MIAGFFLALAYLSAIVTAITGAYVAVSTVSLAGPPARPVARWITRTVGVIIAAIGLALIAFLTQLTVTA